MGLVLALVVPVLELYVFVLVADAIGFLNALGLAILVSLVGVWLVKRAGLRALQRYREQTARGARPATAVVDGLLLLVAGGLLLFPGFVTGAVGLALLLPPVRALARPLVLRGAGSRVRIIRARYGGRIVDTSATDEGRDEPRRGELDP